VLSGGLLGMLLAGPLLGVAAHGAALAIGVSSRMLCIVFNRLHAGGRMMLVRFVLVTV